MVIIYRSLPFKNPPPYPWPHLTPEINGCCRTVVRVTESAANNHQRDVYVHSSAEGVADPQKLKMSGGIVALGKFDALHIGHRELAIQASKVGAPFLLSFVGMAEVLGWEPRAPIVAECDRKRVLLSWAPYCGNLAPQEFQVNFSSVRHLTPRQFVEKLSREFGVHGVVAGENYRFGYKASGDASALVSLCKEYNMGAYIISSVMDKKQNSINKGCNDLKERGQVSSTRVRHALAQGDMKYVSELLGRQHRLMLTIKVQEGFTCSEHKVSMPKSCLLNLPPKEGVYEQCFLLIHDENPVPCRVTIGSTQIYLELDEELASASLRSYIPMRKRLRVRLPRLLKRKIRERILMTLNSRVFGPYFNKEIKAYLATLRNVKIKTATCICIIRELRSYVKEVESEATKTAEMKGKGEDPYDLERQENVSTESSMKIPECRKRLEAAFSDLEGILAELKEFDQQEGAVIKEARSILARKRYLLD